MSGTTLRPGRHRCDLPAVADPGEVWRCDVCRWRWTCRVDMRNAGGIGWSRRFWPWPR